MTRGLRLLAAAAAQAPAGLDALRSKRIDGFAGGVAAATQRLPAPAVVTVARFAQSALSVLSALSAPSVLSRLPTGRLDAWRAAALLVVGEDERAERLLLARSRRASPAQVASLAGVALGWGRPLIAATLLSSAPPTARTGLVAARTAWQSGETVRALELADAAAAARRRGASALATSLRGELALLGGRLPSPPVARLPLRAGAIRGPAPSVPTGAVRVLHLLTNSVPHTSSGYALRSHFLLRAQSEAGLAVLGATRLGYPTCVGRPWAADREVVDGVDYARLLPRRLPADPAAGVRLQADLLMRLAESHAAGVLHTTTHYPNGLTALDAGRRLGLPVVYEVRGFLEDTWASRLGDLARRSPRYRAWQERETACMLAADVVVTLGEVMRSRIIDRGVPAECVVVAPNGIDPAFLEPPPDVRALRQSLGLPSDGVVVGSVTSVVGYEGLDTLARAVALLPPRVRLLIVGDGVALPHLRALVRELGMEHRVVLTGRVPYAAVRRFHAAIDVFAVPRRDVQVCRTVTPLKPVEAMATGRPVVASDLVPLREVVGASGLFVPPGDVSALAGALLALAEDEALRRELGRRGRTQVRGTRTWQAVAARVIASYPQASAPPEASGGARGR